MRHSAFLFFLLAFCSLAQGDEAKSKIIGTWQSDGPATMEYLNKHCVLNEQQRKVFPKLFGTLRITFAPDGTGTVKMGASRLPMPDGGEIVLEESIEKFTYEILGESEIQVVIKGSALANRPDNLPFSLLMFHDADSYSVALADGYYEINGREFFKRVKAEPGK